MKRLRLVHVEWTDAAHTGPGEWVERLPARTTERAITVGILVRENRREVVVCHSVTSEGLMTGVFTIPRSAVRRMVVFDHP